MTSDVFNELVNRHNLEIFDDYAEPGHTLEEDKKGVLLGNWNDLDQTELDELEADWELEWCDEWTSCEICRKLVRTSSDGWGWQPSHVFAFDVGTVCSPCLLADSALLEQYLDQVVKTLPAILLMDLPLEEHDFCLVCSDLDTGIHEGNTNTDFVALSTLMKQEYPENKFIIKLDCTEQFESSYSLWTQGVAVAAEFTDQARASTSRKGEFAANLKNLLQRVPVQAREDGKITINHIDVNANNITTEHLSTEEFIAGQAHPNKHIELEESKT